VLGKKPDIVLLDLGLPDKDGAEVLAGLRSWSSVPVIILSVRNAEEEIVRLLDIGADDYLVKPFNTGELIARIRVAIRHHAPEAAQEVFTSGRLGVNLQERAVTVAGEPVKLTPTEYGLLRLFVQHAGRIITHRQLLREVWGRTRMRIPTTSGCTSRRFGKDRAESPDARADHHRAGCRLPVARSRLRG